MRVLLAEFHTSGANRFLRSNSNLASILRTFRKGLYVFAQHPMIFFSAFSGGEGKSGGNEFAEWHVA